MTSNRWQRSHFWLQHLILILVGVSFFFWFQQNLPSWQKIGFASISLLMTILGGRWLHQRFANTVVKVFKVEFGDLAWLVQRELKAMTIPFAKSSDDEKVELKIHGKGIVLTVESFPLNLMIDDHISAVPAAKITMTPIDGERPFIHTLCQAIDQAFMKRTASN